MQSELAGRETTEKLVLGGFFLGGGFLRRVTLYLAWETLAFRTGGLQSLCRVPQLSGRDP